MGALCSIDKGTGSGKGSGASHCQRSDSFGTSATQYKPGEMVGNMSSGQSDTQVRHFNFKFQQDIAHRTEDGAKSKEAEVNHIVTRMRKKDDEVFARNGLSSGQHFLHVGKLVDETRLFHLARMMPKGAHLHIHFNSMLLPSVLLGYAKDMANMYIWSNYKLTGPKAFDKCRLEFRIFNLDDVRKAMHDQAKLLAEGGDGASPQQARKNAQLLEALDRAESLQDEALKVRAYDELGPNIFSKTYNAIDIDDERATVDPRNGRKEMRYQYFRELWDKYNHGQGDCDEFLIRKLTFSREDVDSFYTENEGDVDRFFPKDTSTVNGGSGNQKDKPEGPDWPKGITESVRGNGFVSNRISARKAWQSFNGRTKMMKGLFNYESAFRRYTRECLEEFVGDNVQYAEIRPNFMPNNQIYDDEGRTQIDNFGTMRCIIEEYENFMKDIGDMDSDGKIIDDPDHRPTFSGIKVIYCTPRSFSKAQVGDALTQCIEMKQLWPDYIAGFDLVGEEAYAEKYPLAHFMDEFTEFQAKCQSLGLDIPFLFHCGETPDDLEGNLDTALALGSKRIGHGYALPRKPHVLEEMKKNDVCVETCPISNMVLGLARRMDEHSVYALLEKEMHCAVSSDNGTLFKSTLSHDFYEVMAGNPDINLYGWKQLAKWSIQHSCLSSDEANRMITEWEKRWQDFIDVVAEVSESETIIEQLQKAREKSQSQRLNKLR